MSVRVSVCLSVPSQWNLFPGLSLAHRSHDQITGLLLVPLPKPPWKGKNINYHIFQQYKCRAKKKSVFPWNMTVLFYISQKNVFFNTYIKKFASFYSHLFCLNFWESSTVFQHNQTGHWKVLDIVSVSVMDIVSVKNIPTIPLPGYSLQKTNLQRKVPNNLQIQHLRLYTTTAAKKAYFMSDNICIFFLSFSVTY